MLQSESTAFPELSRVSEITGNGNKHHTCDILPQVRAPVVSHDLNGIQVILGDVVINDKVNAGNDQLIHHINALCYRVLIVCFKERSCFGIQFLWIKTMGKKVSKNILKSSSQTSLYIGIAWGSLKTTDAPTHSCQFDWYLADLDTGIFFF